MLEWFATAFKAVTGFFKGSGTTQIGKNKSITTGDNSGTIGHIMVADTIHLPPPPVPQKPPYVTLLFTIDTRPAVGAKRFMTENHPDRSPTSYLRVSLNNPTDKTLFVVQFAFEMGGGQLLTIDVDSKTQERQCKREVRPGDSLSFHVEGSVLKRFKPEHFDLQYAVVTTVLGDVYKSEEGELKKCLEHLFEFTKEE